MYILLENRNHVDKYVGVGEKQLYCKGFDYDNYEVGDISGIILTAVCEEAYRFNCKSDAEVFKATHGCHFFDVVEG